MEGKSKQQGLQTTGHTLSRVGRQRAVCACSSVLAPSLPVSLDLCFSVSLGFSLPLFLYLCLSLSLCLCLYVYLSVISVSVFLLISLLSLSLWFSFSLFLSFSLDRDPSQVIRTPTAVLSISTSKIKITLQSVLRGPSSWVILDSGKLAVNPSCHRVSHWSSVSILFRGLASWRAGRGACLHGDSSY